VTEEWKTMTEDPIAEYIDACTEGMCDAYVVIATVQRASGQPSFWITTLKNQTASTTLGLLESASAAEKYRIAKSFEIMDEE
jgi:hypothetical protein